MPLKKKATRRVYRELPNFQTLSRHNPNSCLSTRTVLNSKKRWFHFSFLINTKTKITKETPRCWRRGKIGICMWSDYPFKNSVKMLLWLFWKTNDVAKKKLWNYEALEVSTEAYWTPSSLIVQTWLGDCGSSGRRTTRPPLGRTGAQDNGFVFPNKVTWGRIKIPWGLHISFNTLTKLFPLETDANKTRLKRCSILPSWPLTFWVPAVQLQAEKVWLLWRHRRLFLWTCTCRHWDDKYSVISLLLLSFCPSSSKETK